MPNASARRPLAVGRLMIRALNYVAEHPGCTKGEAAKHAATLSTRRGYEAVDRCLAAGLIVGSIPDARGKRYALHLSELGRAYLAGEPQR